MSGEMRKGMVHEWRGGGYIHAREEKEKRKGANGEGRMNEMRSIHGGEGNRGMHEHMYGREMTEDCMLGRSGMRKIDGGEM